MKDWIYQGSPFDDSLIQNNAGFVYIITNLLNRKMYIGKKVFWFNRKVKGKRTKVESDWRDYYGSNNELNDDVKSLRNRELR